MTPNVLERLKTHWTLMKDRGQNMKNMHSFKGIIHTFPTIDVEEKILWFQDIVLNIQMY